MRKGSALRKLLTNRGMTRREFIKVIFFGFLGILFSGLIPRRSQAQENVFNGRNKKGRASLHDLVEVSGENPYLMTVRGIEAMGGMGRFVKKGDTVAIKPNMAWDRAPEYAANTNPMVVAALVELCFASGARRVNVFDRTCNSAERCYDNSGIAAAAREKGAKVYFVDDWNFIKARFNHDSPMQDWPVYRDAVECDTFINVPVLKHHGLTGLTLSMKNLMGVCGGNRGLMHTDIGRKLVDITSFINPDLTVIDGYRFLQKHGPSGGDLNDVVMVNKLIVSIDPTLADAYACGLVNKDPMDIPYISEAFKRKFGIYNIKNADVIRITA